MTLRRLPMEGASLKELSLQGTGKDCVFRLVTTAPSRCVRIEMRDPRLVVEVDGKVSIESYNDGDRDLGVRYRPREELRIVLFELDLWASNDDWDAALARFESGRAEFISEAVSGARIALRRHEESVG